jgi:YidC/Oxa1 family membrane protein insertase
VTQRVVNNGEGAIDLAPYGLISRTNTPEILGFYILHEGPLGVFNGTLEEFDYGDDLKDNYAGQDATIVKDTTGGWLGITDKYWLAALVPDQSAKVKARFVYNQPGGRDHYQSDFVYDSATVAPGASLETTSRLFAGAKVVPLLQEYEERYGIVKFDLAVDFGWFSFLTKPIFQALHWANGQLGNFGLAILALTVVIKLIFFPLANKSYKSMAKMRKLQPKMMELRERYGEDKQRLNQEMMGLYKKEGANPLSGCLPILIQIPVFFALYKVMFVTIEMRHAPFYGWIRDLSAPDPTTILNGFGLFPWDAPELGLLNVLNIGIWPLLMGISMFLQQKLNPQPPDPVQAKVFLMMPVVFTFLLSTFPAGLVIYWTWNNILSMAQQAFIMKRQGVPIGGGSAKPKEQKE